MGLNIKNERVHALAREAARRTGKSQTAAIEEALEALLARLGDGSARRHGEAWAWFESLPEPTAAERDAVAGAVAEMYDDETGLPR